jgi:hypothetical protein
LDYESETAVQDWLNLIFGRTPVQLTQCRMSVFNHSTKNGSENCRKIPEHPGEWSDKNNHSELKVTYSNISRQSLEPMEGYNTKF